MFEREADLAETEMLIHCHEDYSKKKNYREGWQEGATFGYNKAKEELGKGRRIKIKEITEQEFNKLFGMLITYAHNTYFANDCIFDDETDNLIAFSWHASATEAASKYYKVVKEND